MRQSAKERIINQAQLQLFSPERNEALAVLTDYADQEKNRHLTACEERSVHLRKG